MPPPAPAQPRTRKRSSTLLYCIVAIVSLWGAGLAIIAAVHDGGSKMAATKVAASKVAAERAASATLSRTGTAADAAAAMGRPGPQPLPCASLGSCDPCVKAISPSSPLDVCVWCMSTASCQPYVKRSGKFPCPDAVRAGSGYPGGDSCVTAAKDARPKGSSLPGGAYRQAAAQAAAQVAAQTVVFEPARPGEWWVARALGGRAQRVGQLFDERTARILAAEVLAESVPPIWLDRPGSAFEDSLFVGSGRLGASSVGGVLTHALSLNEESLSSGSRARACRRPCGGAYGSHRARGRGCAASGQP